MFWLQHFYNTNLSRQHIKWKYGNYGFALVTSQCTVFALERDFASLYTLWGELSQNELTNASVLSLPGETLKTD